MVCDKQLRRNNEIHHLCDESRSRNGTFPGGVEDDLYLVADRRNRIMNEMAGIYLHEATFCIKGGFTLRSCLK